MEHLDRLEADGLDDDVYDGDAAARMAAYRDADAELNARDRAEGKHRSRRRLPGALEGAGRGGATFTTRPMAGQPSACEQGTPWGARAPYLPIRICYRHPRRIVRPLGILAPHADQRGAACLVIYMPR